MSLKIARQIVELIQQDNEVEIRETLDPYSLEQRRRIVSIKHKRSSLLFIAVAKESVSIVTYFLKSCGANPNSFGCMNGEKLTCLAAAIDVNSVTITGLLLKHGANTELVYSYERTALFHACSDSRERIARLLIEHGANVNSRNYAGETPLTESTDNLNLLRYLISKGTDINSVDDFGQTALMMGFEIERDEIIYFLLSCDNIDVKIRNDYGEDALHLAVRYCCEDIVQEIIKKGCYTNDEIIEVYELESCIFHVKRDEENAKELWQKALKLRSQPSNTPMFQNQYPAGKLQRVVDFLNADDASALLYLESIQGLNSSFTLGAYTCAASNVYNEDKYLTLCEFFFDTIHTLDDRLFFKSFIQSVVLIRHYFDEILTCNILNLLKIFKMFVTFIMEVRFRFENMTPQERMPHANGVECLLYFTIELVCKIDEKYPEDIKLFHGGIRRILKTDLRSSQLKSLTQICIYLQSPDSIIKCFLHCGANVNSRDKEGKTVLHEIVESGMSCQEKIIEKIINNGFDFSLVKCDEYCLPCRMERENIIPHSVKYTSLQCLAARTLCEKTINCLSDVPHYIKMIIDSHFFLT